MQPLFQKKRHVGSMLVTATLLSATGATAAAAATSGRATRSFLVDVEPGTASFSRIEVLASEGAQKGDKTRVSVKVTAALKDADAGVRSSKPEKTEKKKRGANVKDHDLDVDVSVTPSEAAQSVEVPDLNFDGYRDLWLLRELGATGARYDVFIFDPKSGKFGKGAFASEIEKLDSPEVEPMSKTISTRRTGERPARATYRVAHGRLDVVSSCAFEPVGAKTDEVVTGKLTRKKLVNGQLETTTKDVAIPRRVDPCAD